MAECAPSGPVHEPPAFGVPPSWLNKLNEALFEHREIETPIPAFGAVFTVTVTVLEAGCREQVPTTSRCRHRVRLSPG